MLQLAPSGRGKRAHPDTANHQGAVKRPNTSVPPPHASHPFVGVKASFAATPTPGSSSQFVAGTAPASLLPHQASTMSAPVQVLPPQVSTMSSVFPSGSVHSPGVQFPPPVVPGVRPINDHPTEGYQKVKQRKPRKNKAETATAEATKVPTPSRVAPPRSVKVTKASAPMDVSPQDESDCSSECSESDFVNAPPQVDP